MESEASEDNEEEKEADAESKHQGGGRGGTVGEGGAGERSPHRAERGVSV